MKYFAEVGNDGRIVACGSIADDVPTHAVEPSATGAVVVVFSADSPFDCATEYIKRGKRKRFPPRPSPAHEFDFASEAWQLDVELAWRGVRERRDFLLTASDWVVLRASDQGVPVPPEWIAYRQALRDVTEQDDPLNIVWPTAPSA